MQFDPLVWFGPWSGLARSGLGDLTDQTYHSHVWSTRQMVTELLNLRKGQSPVSVRESVRQTVTMISARDASASEEENKNISEQLLAQTSLQNILETKTCTKYSARFSIRKCKIQKQYKYRKF